MYNLTNFTNSNGFLESSIAANQLVGGWLFVLVIVLIYIVSFIGLKRYETKYSLLTAGFITFVLTVSLWGTGVVGDRSLVITFVLLLFSFGFAAYDS